MRIATSEICIIQIDLEPEMYIKKMICEISAIVIVFQNQTLEVRETILRGAGRRSSRIPRL